LAGGETRVGVVRFFASPPAIRHPFMPLRLLPTPRGSLMLDFVVVAMLGIMLLLAFSIYLVRARRNYLLHKRLQIGMALVLLVAVAAFEIDVQFFTKWEDLASQSPYYDSGVVMASLIVHLCFAVPTPLLWAYVIVQALRKYPSPPAPGKHSRAHKRMGWIATIGMALTSFTGWIFYYLACVATK
jgi:putative membrane protein